MMALQWIIIMNNYNGFVVHNRGETIHKSLKKMFASCNLMLPNRFS